MDPKLKDKTVCVVGLPLAVTAVPLVMSDE